MGSASYRPSAPGICGLSGISKKELRERVTWLMIDTHSRRLEGDLMRLLFKEGCVCENEKPSRPIINSVTRGEFLNE
jgi:hypothetical protein